MTGLRLPRRKVCRTYARRPRSMQHEASAKDRPHTEGRGRRKTPWFRQISAHTGLQGKLVLSFMFLLVVTLGAASIQFVNESRQITEQVLGAKATTLANAVGVGAERALVRGDAAELSAVGRKVVSAGDVVGLAFFNAAGAQLSSTWSDGDPRRLHAAALPNPRVNPADLTLVSSLEEPGLGPYLRVTVPVRAASASGDGTAPARVVGFVTVALSESNNAFRLEQSQVIVVLIGAVAVLVSLPLVYLLVHRIFHPIRVLVDATNRIAAGDLDGEVAVHRQDVIGTLARSFNEMLKRVRQQQRDLASANDKLFATNQQLETANEQLATANYQLARANEKLAEANRDLEKKVEQRTAQVETANNRLRREIAEKEDFLRAVSHDLNAPLRNISGMAAMLLMKHRERFDEDIIHRIERIQKNVEVETDLIAELLELSRIKTRRQQFEPVDLNALLNELTDVFEADLKSRQIALIVDAPLPVIQAERARMRQVFLNLVDNAIKYMGEGSGGERSIRIGCTLRAGEVEFHVSDTGIGIEPEDLDKVFFVFRRGKSATVQAVAGKGVGLASVKSIIETYEGTIWVESQVGKGTTFRFTINGKHVPSGEGNPVQGRAA
jgi:signal transduction histidine kinase